MSLRVAILIHLLLLVDKADSKKGELLFVILMEQSLNLIEVLYLAGSVYRESWTSIFQCQLVMHFKSLYQVARKLSSKYKSKETQPLLCLLFFENKMKLL